MVTLHERLPDPDAGSVRIANLWGAMALRGIGAIILAMLAAFWPAITLVVLVLIFAAYCIVDGIFSLILAVRGMRRNGRWWWPALHALVALAAAGFSLLYPEVTMTVFIAMLIAWALLTGGLSIGAAFRHDRAPGRPWFIASGVVSLILAALLMAFPGVGLLTLSWMMAFQALLAGSMLLGLAFRLRMKNAAWAEAGIKGAERHGRKTRSGVSRWTV